MHDVEHPGISRGRIGISGHVSEMKKSEDVEAMVDRDDNDIAAPAQADAVEHGTRARAARKSTAVQPEHHRPFCTISQPARPDVEDQALFAGRSDTARSGIRDARGGRADGCWRRAAVTLRRARPVSQHVPDTRPRRRIDGRHEAVLPGRSRSVRDALEDIHAVLNQAANLPRSCLNNGPGIGRG
jgi:hypothetical protein